MTPLCAHAARLGLGFLAVAAAAPVLAAEADSAARDYAGELPRIAPLEPGAAAAAFAVQAPYRIALAAAEPLVRDPVAMAFDERGRLFVVEMAGYSERRMDRLGSVRLLEDADGDGRFDAASVYVEGLSWPTAVACWDGGVFVADAPDVYYCKDHDGDGVAEARELAYTGFGTGNVQGLVNTFLWGLDNRIHGATSSSGAEAARPGAGGAALALRGRDFAFDPRTRAMTAESGGGQHGMAFDDWGRKYVCSNSDHLVQVLFEDRYAARNPWLAAPSPRASIAEDGPAADVFRISPVEPWRIVRTRLRVKGIVPGIVEGGGRAAGYFTSATGVTIYRGDAWPAEHKGLAIVGDVGSNLIHRKRIDAPGVERVGRRIDAGCEFAASTDIWFRPVQFCNGPDGALYVADMYREVIEHPESLPPIIKKHLDLNSGNDRGRIYRILPQDGARRAPEDLGALDAAGLVARLDRPNAWHRETAARLLYTRQEAAAVPALEALAAAGTPLGRLHALYALDGLGALRAETVAAALADGEPGVRAHALRLAEPRCAASPALRSAMAALAGDADFDVRYQLAFSIGALPVAERVPLAIALARRDGAGPWMQLALATSLADGSDAVLAAILGEAALAPLARSLAQIAGAAADDAALAALAPAMAALRAQDAAQYEALVAKMLEGAASARRDPAVLDPIAKGEGGASAVAGMLARAQAAAADAAMPLEARVRAADALRHAPWAEAAPAIDALLGAGQPPGLQSAAIGVLRAYDTPEAAARILAGWGAYGPGLREEAAEALLARPVFTAALLDAIAAGAIAPAQIDSTRRTRLRTHPDAALRARAEALIPADAGARRAEVVEAYRPVLERQGDAARGKRFFALNCAQCHKAGGEGYDVGPDLSSIGNAGAEKILVNVLDPNREVNPQYLNYVVETKDWESYSGIIAAETATSLTLRRANGLEDTILRGDIESVRSADLSIMPEGWEIALPPEAMADLLAYLMSLVAAGAP